MPSEEEPSAAAMLATAYSARLASTRESMHRRAHSWLIAAAALPY